ncbi:MAG: peptidoglycan bridge formation glycyltransferase FemA/FemB family protein [Chloroflexota bacterium]|nr:peptidoglycan bridge formation glycyltransferase FemA/FemB family protein [Chloroflexota bacterium]
MLGANPRHSEDHEGAEWDAALERLGGDLLQSWRWGEFKQRQGWVVTRLQTVESTGSAMAQVLVRRAGPLRLAYLPRGPVVADSETEATELLEAIDEVCAQHRAAILYVEPDQHIPTAWIGEGSRFARGPESFQTARTVKVPLLDDEALYTQMRKDTRANLRHAERRGVVVEHWAHSSSEIHTFYELLRETSRRNGFGIHSLSYYTDFLHVFGDQATLMFTRLDGVVTAALIAARCGVEGRSMYAGSSTAHRSRGDTALLRFEAMRWARAHGCSVFDLGGIGGEPPTADSRRDHHSDDLHGLRQFKLGFGGEVVSYPPTLERRYRPAVAWLIRHVHPRFRPAPETS